MRTAIVASLVRMAPNDGDRLAELPPLGGVGDGFGECGAGAAGGAGAELQAPVVEDVEGDLVAAADLAEHVARRHACVLQDHRRRRRGVQPHLVLFLADRHAGEAALDDERGERLAVDLGEDDEDVGEAGVGDPHLLAGQREAAVGEPGGAGPRAERIRARPRLAETVGADHLARGEARQVALLLRRVCRRRSAAGSPGRSSRRRSSRTRGRRRSRRRPPPS